MSAKKFEVEVLSQYCKGCGLCVEVCREGKLYLEKTPNERGIQPAAVDPRIDCTGCLDCATICPDAAIEIYMVEAHAARGAPADSLRH